VACEISSPGAPEENIDERVHHSSPLGVRPARNGLLGRQRLGGVIAIAGLLSPPVPQALALAASAVPAPAFEPVAKLAVAMVRTSGYAVARSLVALLAGYMTPPPPAVSPSSRYARWGWPPPRRWPAVRAYT